MKNPPSLSFHIKPGYPVICCLCTEKLYHRSTSGCSLYETFSIMCIVVVVTSTNCWTCEFSLHLPPQLMQCLISAVVSQWALPPACAPAWMEVTLIIIFMKTARIQSLFMCLWLNNVSVLLPRDRKKSGGCLFLCGYFLQSRRRMHDNTVGDKLLGTMWDGCIVLVRCTAVRTPSTLTPPTQTDLIFPAHISPVHTMLMCEQPHYLEKRTLFIFLFK